MSNSKQKLEERLGGASLVLMECAAILAATDRAQKFAERTGHPALGGEIAAIRRAVRTARQKATVVSDRLRERIKAED